MPSSQDATLRAVLSAPRVALPDPDARQGFVTQEVLTPMLVASAKGDSGKDSLPPAGSPFREAWARVAAEGAFSTCHAVEAAFDRVFAIDTRTRPWMMSFVIKNLAQDGWLPWAGPIPTPFARAVFGPDAPVAAVLATHVGPGASFPDAVAALMTWARQAVLFATHADCLDITALLIQAGAARHLSLRARDIRSLFPAPPGAHAALQAVGIWTHIQDQAARETRFLAMASHLADALPADACPPDARFAQAGGLLTCLLLRGVAALPDLSPASLHAAHH